MHLKRIVKFESLKTKQNMRVLFFLFLCYSMISCKFDKSDLQNSTWKIYQKSSNDFGDVISFKNMDVKNDTIFFNNEPIYLIVEYRNRYFMDKFITIKSLNTQNIATYINK
jgi:hypothetical protein